MTPFRASWTGSPESSPTADPTMYPLRVEARRALQDLCQGTPASFAENETRELPTKADGGVELTEGAELPSALTECSAAPLVGTGAAIALRLAMHAAAQLGLGASLRNAAETAALQLRVWDGQAAALLAEAWTAKPGRSRTCSGAGAAVSLIRLSATGSTGTGLELDSERGGVMPQRAASGLAMQLSPQADKRLHAAVTVVWSVPRVHAGARAVLCWP